MFAMSSSRSFTRRSFNMILRIFSIVSSDFWAIGMFIIYGQPRLNSAAYFLIVETMVKIRPNLNQARLFIFVGVKPFKTKYFITA